MLALGARPSSGERPHAPAHVCGVVRAPAQGDFEALRLYLREVCVDAYYRKARAMDEFEPGLMNEAQRYFLLTNTDNLWKEHLQAIKFLQQAVGLRGYAAKDPLTEFKLEGSVQAAPARKRRALGVRACSGLLRAWQARRAVRGCARRVPRAGTTSLWR